MLGHLPTIWELGVNTFEVDLYRAGTSKSCVGRTLPHILVTTLWSSYQYMHISLLKQKKLGMASLQ